VAAAEDSQALGLIIRAGSRLGLEPQALGPAEQAGIVSVAADQIMFGHPLARSATYTGAAYSGLVEAASASRTTRLAPVPMMPQTTTVLISRVTGRLAHDLALSAVRGVTGVGYRAASWYAGPRR
jgi:hypothetical protein